MKTVIHAPDIVDSKTLLDHGIDANNGDITSFESAADNIHKTADTLSESAIDTVGIDTKKSIAELMVKIDLQKKEYQSLEEKYFKIKGLYEDQQQNLNQLQLHAQEKGYEKGMESAKDDLNNVVSKRIKAGERLIEELNNKLIEDVYQQEEICLEIVYSAVSRVIGDAAGSKEQVRSIVKLAIDKVANPDNLHVYVSPHDYKQMVDDEFINHQIIRSDDITHGGCIIKSGKGTVEAKLDKQLQRLKELLLNIHRAEESNASLS